MAKLPRIFQKVFASTAEGDQRHKFGSMASGSPQNAANVGEVQAKSGIFQRGLFGAVLGNLNPAIEDINSLFWLAYYKLAYKFQSGIPEWIATETYYSGQMVSFGQAFYKSLVDDNLGNSPSLEAFWQVYRNPKDLTVLQNLFVRKFSNVDTGENSIGGSIVYAEDKKIFVAARSGATLDVVWSDDEGKTWNSATIAGAAAIRGGLTYSQLIGRFFTANQSYNFQYSVDGATWVSLSTLPSGGTYTSLFAADAFERIFAFKQASNAFAVSTDEGATWNSSSLADLTGVYCYTYSQELGAMLVAGLPSNRLAYSINGINWSRVDVPVLNPSAANSCIARSDALNRFVMFPGISSLLPNLHYAISSDGLNWTAILIEDAQGLSGMTYFSSVVWNDGLGLFILVGENDTIFSSADGLSWTRRYYEPEASTSLLAGIATSENSGTFIIGKTGTTTGVLKNL